MGKKYIECEAAMAAACKALCHPGFLCPDFKCAEVRNAFNAIPAADVRPVVFCKDCKYYFKDADGYEMCENSEGYDHVTEDGFCAWAKKREES